MKTIKKFEKKLEKLEGALEQEKGMHEEKTN